ncbi:MAG: EAL domain-containing protein [Gammaproteobacteria bacterium]|nr:EAL domain-containing protein [Gammaproteobacteria bacterium]
MMPTTETLDLWEQELRHGHYRLRDLAPSQPDRGKAIEVENMLLGSAFTPIYSRAHDRPVGHRPTLRFLDRDWADDPAAARAELARRDPLGRTAALSPGLHMTNYRETVSERGWLFLPAPAPVLSRSSLWPPLPQDLFSSSLFAPKDIVLEVSVDAASIAQIEDFTRYHQELGFIVAVTEFGRQHADLAAIWRIRPDLVEIPLRALGERAVSHEGRALTALCRVLHESGAMVALTGIDMQDALDQALLTDTDLLEGERAGERGAQPAGKPATPPRPEPRATLEASLQAIAGGATFESACERLLNEEGVLRCYLLDGHGTQLADNLSPVGVRSDARYWPLANAIGASWSHREYFKSALSHPGQVMRTGPYFSLPDGRHCLTLSIARSTDDQTLVLCCDLAEASTS